MILSIAQSKITSSLEETQLFGQEIGIAMKALPPQPVALFGDLGSGKTTLVKGIIQGLLNILPHEITSPTFQYATFFESESKQIYIAHCDLWRLQDEEEFFRLGLVDLFTNYYLFIEWPERIQSLLHERKKPILAIEARWKDENIREYTLIPEYIFSPTS